MATPRRAQQHLHSPSAASSAFDDSDGSADEADLARKSARMQPRNIPVVPHVRTAPAAATDAAFPPARHQSNATFDGLASSQQEQQQQLQLMLQMQHQMMSQQGMLQHLLQSNLHPQPSSGHGRPGVSATAAGHGQLRPGLESLEFLPPAGSGSLAAGCGFASVARGHDPTSQQQLQEQYVRQWSSITPYTTTAAPGTSQNEAALRVRLPQDASLASSLGPLPPGIGLSRTDTRFLAASTTGDVQTGPGDGAAHASGSAARAWSGAGPMTRAGFGAASGLAPGACSVPRAQDVLSTSPADCLPGEEAEANARWSTEVRAPGGGVVLRGPSPAALMPAHSLSPSGAGVPATSPANGQRRPCPEGDDAGAPMRNWDRGDETGVSGGDAGQGADANADVRLQPAEQGKGRDAPSADQVAENLENIDALALFNPEEDDDEEGDADDLPPPWYRRPAVLWFLGSIGLGLLLLVIGVILQNVLFTTSDAFRWFYFFAGMPLLYYILSYIVRRVFMVIEWWFFRESLFYLHNVQRKAAWLLFFLVLLPWFCAMFRWTWCSGVPSFPRRCQVPAYVQATNILWNCLLCLMLFCLANMLKAVLAKILTTHFYRTAHFKKLKKALEKEYVLQVLSRPRRLVMAERARASAHAHGGVEGQLGGWFSMSMFHHGPVSARRLPIGAAGGDGAAASTAPAAGAGPSVAPQAAAAVEAHCSDAAGRKGRNGQPNVGAVAGHAPSSRAPQDGQAAAVGTSAAGSADAPVLAGHALALSPVAGPNPDLREQTPHISNPLYVHQREHDATPTHPGEASASATLSSHGLPAPLQNTHGSGTGGPSSSGMVCMTATATAPAVQQAPGPYVPPPRPPDERAAGGAGSHVELSAEAMTPQGQGQANSRLPADRAGDAGASQAGFAHGLGQLLRRQDSRASRVSRVSAVKASAKVPATGNSKKGEEILSQAMVEVVPPGNGLTAQKGLHRLTEAELEKVRTAIVIKTQTALISKYAEKSEEDMEKELGRVKRFAKALYFNVLPPEAGRAHLLLEDFLVFFEGADGGGAGGDGAASGAGTVAASPWKADGGAGALARKSAGGGANLATTSAAVGGATSLARATRVNAAERARAARRKAEAEDAAKKAFAIFDADGNGEASRPEVKEAVLNIYKERRNMARSLVDTETIVKSLEFGIGVVIHFVFAAVYLLIWGVDLLTGFSTFSATVLALTFVFGNSVKNMYESMLFLFVTHPYDVGDCVLIGTDMYRVKKISLLYTDMVRANGERVYMPNTVLISQNITNWTRSRTKTESCRLVCDVGVAWEVRDDIQAALRAYAREHPGEFDGEPSCNFRELADPLKVVLVCSWNYNFAPDEFSRIGPARNGMLFVVQQKAREHRLQHTAVTERSRD